MIIDIRSGLHSFLLADVFIPVVVEDRIYPNTLKQGVQLPSIVYSRVSGLGDHHMQGASGLTRPRFQIDAYARNPDDANGLADLVKLRLDGFRGQMSLGGSPEEFVQVQGIFFDTEREDYQGEIEMYRISRDYLIWFSER
jgi:hypothetical protein